MTKRRQNYMRQADKAFAEYVKQRDKRCLAVGYHRKPDCNGGLQACHIHSRSYKAIRTNPDNCIAMCQGHHMYFTQKPLEWHEFVEELNPGLWDDLKELALAYERVDWKAEAAYWKEQT